jgi:hypothetical protein
MGGSQQNLSRITIADRIISASKKNYMNFKPVHCFAIAAVLTAIVCFPVVAAPGDGGYEPPVFLNGGWSLADVTKVSATGDVISSESYRPMNWHVATVPGTVLTSLVNDGIYPEPLFGENNRPWVIPDSLCRTSYWYRTQFSLPKSYANSLVQLNFDGINYIADVWLNGHDLGSIDGAFARGRFDVSSVVKRSGPNVLAVEILPPPDPGVPREHLIGSHEGNGGILASDGPTFLCTISWDWIPGIRDRDIGIWQDVYLSAQQAVAIRDTDVTSALPLPHLDSADLTIRTTLVNSSARNIAGYLVGSFGNTSFRDPISLNAHETDSVALDPATVKQLHVVYPKLWWPNGYGPQNLYTLRLKFVESTQVVSDIQSTIFGIRQITYSVPNSVDLTISVNGVPVLCKGGDWGLDEALKREPYSRLDAQIRLHRDAHYTMIRNWVGQSTSEEFYDLCDKYGILIWDEMFQPNPSDGPNPKDVGQYIANVREKILRFRCHPSIALWCGRNEGFPPPVIDDANRRIAADLDPERLYQPSSTDGRGVHSGGPYYWRAPRFYYKYNEAFKTEIGSVSIPTLESVESMMPSYDWNKIDNDWAEHDLTNSAGGGNWYPIALAQRYGPFNNLADFVRKGQMANYEAFRAMYEGRNSKLFNPVTGVLTWMSNPAQPSFVWQIYSWDLEPNASFFAVRKACEPVHIQLNQSDWHAEIINNTPQPLANYTAKVSVYNLNGELKSTHTDTITSQPSAATDDGLVNFPADLSPVHFVKLELRDARARLVSDNFYWRETSLDDFTALNSLPPATLTGTVSHHVAGSNIELTVTLTNHTSTPAIMAHLQLRRATSLRRVLPVYYSDNYISLLPGESKTISVEAALSDFNGEAPLLVVDGWNVTVIKTAGIQPNADTTIPDVADEANSPDYARINCGGGNAAPYYTFGTPSLASGEFSNDADVVLGRTVNYGVSINTSAPNAAPLYVYQSARLGPTAYTIPIAAGKTYTVRLHFAEPTFDTPALRLFNVDINGTRVLTNFDIFATAGGEDIAVVKDFPNVQPDQTGHITIDFSNGDADQPLINGIEILPS